LAGNRGHHHSRTTALRQNFGDIAATDREIGTYSDPDEQLSHEQHCRSFGQRTDTGAGANNHHVGEHQLFSAKTVRHRSANSGSNDSTKHQARSNETHHVGLNVKVSDDDRHRHAKNENGVTIEQRAAGREHPKPSLNPIQRRLIQQERQALW
jgi:hypothetical protein